MEFLNEYGFLILTILGLVLAVLIVVALFASIRLNKKLLSERLHFKWLTEVDAATAVSSFSILIINRTLSDKTVNAAGIIENDKHYDFAKDFGDKFFLVGQRSSFKLELDRKFIERTLIDGSEKKRLKKVFMYSIDKEGNLSKARARVLKKTLNKKQISTEKAEKRAAAEEKARQKAEQKSLAKQEKSRLRTEFLQKVEQTKTDGKKVGFLDKLIAFYYKLLEKK